MRALYGLDQQAVGAVARLVAWAVIPALQRECLEEYCMCVASLRLSSGKQYIVKGASELPSSCSTR